MKELEKPDNNLKTSKSKVVKYKNKDGKFVELDLGREWDGAKNLSDFTLLSTILKSEKHGINGIWSQNSYFDGFKNLESKLFNTVN